MCCQCLNYFPYSSLYVAAKIFSLQLLLFGGHGTGGWLSRYDIYYNDSIVLDRGECFTTLLAGFLADMCWMCYHDVNEPSILFML